ncbi:hypothetical protein [uncultured Roseovarius sp.]|uniref:hypothetical protein n=1 Tax=uncultured Roseovarius sp. TaxID=293344 RepID=UPI002630BC32|nr:hypothetical protein [uncultured Roseovarius sp.]
MEDEDLFSGPDRENPDRIWEAMMRVRGGSAARANFVLHWIEEVGAAAAFWPIVSRAWSGFDRIPHEEFAYWFHVYRRSVPKVEGLPRRMTVYRGQDASAPLGLSWTRSRTVAEAFARGHRIYFNPNPIVHERVITPGKVAFTCDDCEESEIVLIAIPD